MDLAEVRGGLERLIPDLMGTSSRLTALTESDGHAGLTFLFDVSDAGGATASYVIKLPPKGVRRRGNTDVYRQAPLLRKLFELGLPVPEVPWAREDNDWFDVPFIVMTRLPGRTFFVWDPHPEMPRDQTSCEKFWEQSAHWLARVHAVDWHQQLPDWEAPASLEREITRWERIYAQAPEPMWAEACERVEGKLLDQRPRDTAVGLFHGDYQPGNCLYRGTELVGIIDWVAERARRRSE